MARDPNKYRDDEDLNEQDEEAEDDDFDGRPEQIGDDEDASLEDSGSVRAGRRGAKSHTGRRDD